MLVQIEQPLVEQFILLPFVENHIVLILPSFALHRPIGIARKHIAQILQLRFARLWVAIVAKDLLHAHDIEIVVSNDASHERLSVGPQPIASIAVAGVAVAYVERGKAMYALLAASPRWGDKKGHQTKGDSPKVKLKLLLFAFHASLFPFPLQGISGYKGTNKRAENKTNPHLFFFSSGSTFDEVKGTGNK